MTTKNVKRLITAVFLSAALHAYGADAPAGASPTAPSESDDWAALQKEAASLKTRAEIAKYRADIARAEADARSAAMQGTPTLSSPLPGGPLPPQGGMVDTSIAQASGSNGAGRGRPSLIRIGVVDAQYNARIEVNGNPIDVRAGDTLDGGWSVVSIDASSVKLRHGKQPIVVLR